MTNDKLYVRRRGVVRGPFTRAELRALGEDGRVFVGDLVGTGPNGPWREATSVRGLAVRGESHPARGVAVRRARAPRYAPLAVGLSAVCLVGYTLWAAGRSDPAADAGRGPIAAASTTPAPAQQPHDEPAAVSSPPSVVLPVVPAREARLRLAGAVLGASSEQGSASVRWRLDRLAGWTTDDPVVASLLDEARRDLEAFGRHLDELRAIGYESAGAVTEALFEGARFVFGVQALADEDDQASTEDALDVEEALARTTKAGLEVAQSQERRDAVGAALGATRVRLGEVVRRALAPLRDEATGCTPMLIDVDHAATDAERHVVSGVDLEGGHEVVVLDVTRADASREVQYIGGTGVLGARVDLGDSQVSPPAAVDVLVLTPDGCRRGRTTHDADDRRDDAQRWLQTAALRVDLLPARPGAARGLQLLGEAAPPPSFAATLHVVWRGSDEDAVVETELPARLDVEQRSKRWTSDPREVSVVLRLAGVEQVLHVGPWIRDDELPAPSFDALASSTARTMSGMVLRGGAFDVVAGVARFEPGEPIEGGSFEVDLDGVCDDCGTPATVRYGERIDATPHRLVHVCSGCTAATSIEIVDPQLGAYDDAIAELASLSKEIPRLLPLRVGDREEQLDAITERATEIAEGLEAASPAHVLALTVAADSVRRKGNARRTDKTDRPGSALSFFQEARALYTEAWDVGGGGRYFGDDGTALDGDSLRATIAFRACLVMLREADFKAKHERRSYRVEARNLYRDASGWLAKLDRMQRDGLPGTETMIAELGRMHDQVGRLIAAAPP